MKYSKAIFLLLTFTLILCSCSNTKYSGVNQYYKNFTTKYNTYFNIQNRYKVGYREATNLKAENISNILSIFPYENTTSLFESVSKFNETTVKVDKLLTIKPYTKWMDDALLIEGKIRYLKGQYDSSTYILQDIVDNYQKGYKGGHLVTGKLKWYDNKVKEAERNEEYVKIPFYKHKFAKNEATVWLIKSYIKNKQIESAKGLIEKSKQDLTIPEEYHKEIRKTEAMLLINQKKYEDATNAINETIELTKKKKEKGRLYFIRGQLQELQNDRSLALKSFEYALENKLKTDLKIEANLKTIALSNEPHDVLITKLKKLLNKGSYKKYLSKVYFEIGNQYLKVKNIDEAMVNYNLASKFATNNDQKFEIFLQIAQSSFKVPEYIVSAAYYDSAVNIIPANYDDKIELQAKAASLQELLKNYSIYKENDSILDLVAMGKDRAAKQIEKTLKAEKKRQQQAELESQAKNDALSKESTSKTWYFGNPSSVEKGKAKFQKTWGALKLADNWRLQDESKNAFADNETNDDEDSEIDDMSLYDIAMMEVDRLPFDKKSRGPYIKKTQNALYQMAKIYYLNIKDNKFALQTFDTLFSKYPNNIEEEDEVLYTYFSVLKDVGQLDQAQVIKDKLKAKYPKSQYTQYAINPNLKSNSERFNDLINRNYERAFSLFKKGRYSQAISICNKIRTLDSFHPVIAKAELLKAYIYSYSLQGKKFEKTLKHIVAKYPNTPESKQAQEFLDILYKEDKILPNLAVSNKLPNLNVSSNNKLPESKLEEIEKPISKKVNKIEEIKDDKEEEKEQTVQYRRTFSEPHLALFYLAGDVNPRVVKTLIQVYNKSKWNSSSLSVETIMFGAYRFIAVGNFDNMQKATVYTYTMKDDVMLNTLFENSELFSISSSNLELLKLSKEWEKYQEFFNANY